MVLKIINATEAKVGTSILIDGKPFTIRKIDISKTGKHGHSKARIEASAILSNQKKVFVVPGHDRLEVPLVEKKKGQVLSISGDGKVSVMDLESYETIDLPYLADVEDAIEVERQVEYADIEGKKAIMRVLSS